MSADAGATLRPEDTCRICGATAKLRFQLPLAHGLTGSYFECTSCGFLHSPHLEDPAALQRVYARAAADEDPGAALRQYCVAQRLSTFARAGVFGRGSSVKTLDFGSGSGFVPAFLGQTAGFDARGYDAFTTPTFAPARHLTDWRAVKASGPFRLVSATEVLEHFTDPLAQLAEIASVMDPDGSFLYVMTEVYDPAAHGPRWDYLAPHTAQHCSFYSRAALEVVARKIGASMLVRAGGRNEWLFVRGRPSTARLHVARLATALMLRLGLAPRLG